MWTIAAREPPLVFGKAGMAGEPLIGFGRENFTTDELPGTNARLLDLSEMPIVKDKAFEERGVLRSLWSAAHVKGIPQEEIKWRLSDVLNAEMPPVRSAATQSPPRRTFGPPERR